MVLGVFNQFQQIVEHVFICARVEPVIELLLALVLLLDLFDKKLHLFFEIFVPASLVLLVGRLKLDFGDGWALVRLQHLYEHLLGLGLPLEFPMLLELDLLQGLIVHEGLAHQNQALVRDGTEVDLLDMLITVTGLQNPEDTVVAEEHILETYLLDRVLWVRQQSIANVDAGLVLQTLVLTEHQLRNILSAITCQCFLEIQT